MRKPLLLSLLLFCVKFALGQIPTISSFAPLKGAIGTTVTITGNGFNTSAANDVVFFGATRASVTAASATNLTVTVPVGATYQPITVLNTATGLMAASATPFLTTFSPNRGAITAGDIAAKADLITGNGPYNIAVADFDGDGKPDLVSANSTSSTISVFRNISVSGSLTASSFASKSDFTTGTGGNFVTTADVDADGKLDIIVANASSNSISVFDNTSTSGNITFAFRRDFFGVTNPAFVTTGDLDGDGRPEIIATNYNGSAISVLRNNSSNTSPVSFASAVQYAVGSQPFGIAISDIDGDGKLDIAVSCYGTGKVAILRNTTSGIGNFSTGSFAAQVTYTVSSGALSAIAAGDIDGDGKPDLITADYSGNVVAVLRNVATSGTIDASSLSAPVTFSTGVQPTAISLGDIDGDGRPDVVAANYSGGSVSILRNTSVSGTVGLGTNIDLTIGGAVRGVTVADLDGDGKPDIATANYGSATASLFRNNPLLPPNNLSFTPLSGPIGSNVVITGNGFSNTVANNSVYFGGAKATVSSATATTLQVQVPVGVTNQNISVSNLTTGLTGYSAKPFTLTFANGSIGLKPKVDFTSPNYSDGIAIGDIDGDGKADLVATDFFDSKLLIYLNTSASGSITASSFASPVVLTVGYGPYGVALGDLDGDGKLDIAMANYNANTVSVLRNHATSGSVSASSFDVMANFTVGTQPAGIKIADLDGDGKPDIVTADYGGPTVSILRNVSTQGSIVNSSFAANVDITTGNNPYSLDITDIDGDGKSEIITANYFGPSVSVLKNISSGPGITTGSFAAKVDFTTGVRPYSVAAGDLDGDGKPDLAVANSTDGTVSVLRNTSTSGAIDASSFAAKVDFTVGSSPRWVSIADIDGDGKPELAVSAYVTNTVSIFHNVSTSGSLTPSSFESGASFTTGNSPYPIAAGDLDGDGKTDIVVATGDNTISVYRNGAIAPSRPASNVVFTNTTTTGTIISWTNGNGIKRCVFMLAGAAGSPSPVDNTSYAANTIFGSGAQIGSSGWYCVYNGSGSTVSVTGLTAGTTYRVMVIDYNPSGTEAAYQTGAGTGNPANITTTFSSVATLSALSLSTGNLSPAFTSGNTSYTTNVANGNSSIAITPTSTDNAATIKVNGVAVASGNSSQAIPLTVGNNTVTTVVTAQDGVTTQTYTVNVTRAPSSVATLSNLTLSAGNLTPAFTSGTASYSANVSNATSSITITPTATDNTATIKVNGATVTSGNSSQAVSLVVGNNTITMAIIAQDGTTTQTYTVNVTRAPSSVATLSNLTLSAGSLSPVFASGTTNYTASVSNATSSINITPTASEITATIKVNGTPVASGSPSQAISLAVGSNTITTVVTAQDGTTIQTYTTTVTRTASSVATLSNLTLSAGTLTPTFSSGTTNYTASVSNAISSLTITPTVSDNTSSVTVNGIPVTSGNPSQAVALSVGNNKVTTVVTAQDGSTILTYNLIVTRAASNNAKLNNFTTSAGLLTPAFSSGTTAYTASVSNATTSITVTPAVDQANATVTVNGTPVTSGNASQVIALNVGSNIITTVVTAQDGSTTQNYTLTVTRAGSSNANLNNLTTTAGALTPAFASGITSYTVSVNNATTSITVTPTVDQANATVTVNGTPVTSGNTSQQIALNVGSNTVNTVVTAQDGLTTQTYTILITRSGVASRTITFNSLPGKVFGDADFSPGASINSGETPLYSSSNLAVATIVNGNIHIVGAGTTVITASAPVNPNYLATTPVTQNLSVDKAQQTISFAAIPDQVKGSTYDLSGVKSSIGSAIVFSTSDFTVAYVSGSSLNAAGVGHATITADAAGNSNYYAAKSTSQTVNVTSNDPANPVAVHEALSPNGDGINDTFILEGITDHPDNQVSIYTKNGVLIYQISNYDNKGNAFDGHSNITSDLQQAGTYFYVIQYTDNGKKYHQVGTFVIKY